MGIKLYYLKISFIITIVGIIISAIIYFRLRYCICIPKPEKVIGSYSMSAGQLLTSSNNYQSLVNSMLIQKQNLQKDITNLEVSNRDLIKQINKRIVQLGQMPIKPLNSDTSDLEINLLFDSLKSIKVYFDMATKPYDLNFYTELVDMINSYLNTTTLSLSSFTNAYNESYSNLVGVRTDMESIIQNPDFDLDSFRSKLNT